MKSILLVSHGSKAPKAREEIEALASQLKKKSGVGIVQPAFLEIESPDITGGIRQCVRKGATEVTILLNFLNSGRHVADDIRSENRPAGFSGDRIAGHHRRDPSMRPKRRDRGYHPAQFS